MPLLVTRYALLLLLLYLPTPLLAQPPTPNTAEAAQAAERAARLEQTRQQLQELQQSLSANRARMELLRQELQQATDADANEERETLEAQLEQLETQRHNLRATFENIALGGVDLGIFGDLPDQEDFNWQDELLSIMRPLFSEMRQLTERPRAIERLRRDRALLNQQINVVNVALNNLDAIPTDGLDELALDRLRDLENQWQERQTDLMRQQGIIQLQLDNLLERDETLYDQANRAVREFFVGRGLTLLLAITAFGLTFFVLHGSLNTLLRYRERRSIPRRGFKTRLLLLTYRLFATLLALLVFMMVLYAAGDLVLFALALVVVIALLLSFRTYLPHYMAEAKLFLNAGQVREQERLLYNGVPWKVSTIGLYTRLVNPELDNGVLRLPMAEIAGLISRPVPNEEPWFPCRPDEYVLLSDETFGLVERQTPELVQLKVKGTSVFYPTAEFLAAKPRNLSRHGFLVIVTFGIDYQHQRIALDDVPQIFNQAVREALAASSAAEELEDVLVEFSEAADSSLNYITIATFNGAAAQYYFKLSRIVQAACVAVCNEHDWIIPFNQLTVHHENGFDALTSDPVTKVEK